MLILTRRMNESVMIGQNVEVIVLEVNKNQVSLGINAPLCIPVHREEVFRRIQAQKIRNDKAYHLSISPGPRK